MNNKTLWIGFVAVFVVFQVMGYLVHSVLLADTYETLAAVFRPELAGIMWMMMLGQAAYLLVFCYIFTIGHEGKGIAEGVRYGALMGLFLSIPMAVDQYVVFPISGNLAIMWFVSSLVFLIVCGAVFAAIYKPAAAA